MKLMNPTDDELNAAFAEKVAGWWLWPGYRDQWCDGTEDRGKARFTTSFDAVLPWLGKWRTIAIDWDRIAGLWSVGVGQHKDTPAYSPVLPRAAVIALLRAAGVEVEFTA